MFVCNYRNEPAKLAKIANASLVIGIVLWLVIAPEFPRLSVVLHAAAGLFLGVSIGANLHRLSTTRPPNSVGR